MSNIIGPFIGPHGSNGAKIFIALPDNKKIEKLKCKLFDGSAMVSQTQSDIHDEVYRLFIFEFEGLDENKTYRYEFYDGENVLDLNDGLSSEDCKFKPLGSSGESDSLILISCNNPFEEEVGSADSGWAMWERLSDVIHRDNSIRLLVLGGDQLYNDDVEKEFMKRLKKNPDDGQLINDLRERFIKQYQKYWGNVFYRKVLASIPSVAMWDDHDITDGFGSRPDAFENGELKSEWQIYFKIARESFEYYQASRNPGQIRDLPNNVFTSYVDFGRNRLLLADFRSERNTRNNKLWSDEHRDAVFHFVNSDLNDYERVFFLSPVVPLRTNFSGDRRLSRASQVMFYLKKHVKSITRDKWKNMLSWAIPVLLIFAPSFVLSSSCLILPLLGGVGVVLIILRIIPLIPELPELSDDIEDGLSSSSNIESLKRLLEFLFNVVSNNKEVFILSGDVHIGGLTEIIDTRKDRVDSILQIVSSPIAYKPMPKVVEGLTTTTSEMVLYDCNGQKRLFARNIFYTSKRNFVQIFPNRSKNEKRIYFFWEGHQFPITFNSLFT